MMFATVILRRQNKDKMGCVIMAGPTQRGMYNYIELPRLKQEFKGDDLSRYNHLTCSESKDISECVRIAHRIVVSRLEREERDKLRSAKPEPEGITGKASRKHEE
jgi:hypothetical protein